MSSCHAEEVPPCHAPKRSIDWLLWGSAAIVAAAYAGQLALGGVHAHGDGWWAGFAHSVFELVNTMWWGVLIGVLMISLLNRVPREFVMSALGAEAGGRGVMRAAFAGVLLDLCSHGVLMVGTKLYERGASTGQVIAFLVSSPWNSFSLVVLLVALIGVGWTAAFVLLSMVVAVITGLVFDRLVRGGVLPANQNRHELPEGFRFWPAAKTQLRAVRVTPATIASMLADGVRESRMVVRWILFGVVLASLLRALVSPDQFEALFGPTLLGLAVTMVLATVLEVCSEGSTPIAADILTRAGAPGNSFAFLMGGVATDYTEVVVLKEATGSWRVALFLPLVTLPQVLLIAVLINLATG